MTTMTPAPGTVTGGVDTHADLHVAAAVDHLGGVLGTAQFPTAPAGYRRLLGWLGTFGPLHQVGVEGTGSYGVGTTVAQLREGAGEQALQVTAGDVPVPPTFRLTDQSSFFGTLTGTGPRDTALFVEAGRSCGE